MQLRVLWHDKHGSGVLVNQFMQLNPKVFSSRYSIVEFVCVMLSEFIIVSCYLVLEPLVSLLSLKPGRVVVMILSFVSAKSKFGKNGDFQFHSCNIIVDVLESMHTCPCLVNLIRKCIFSLAVITPFSFSGST